MSGNDSPEDREPALPKTLARAVDVLREEPVVDADWRAALSKRAVDERTRRVWTQRAVRALAASVCAAALVGGARIVVPSRFARQAGQAPTQATVARLAATPVRFTLHAPNASHVSLVGDFDGWNPRAVPMTRVRANGMWTVEVRLPPGRHAFAYAVDGGLRTDPTAPRAGGDDFGLPNSVVVVPRDGHE